MKKCIFLLLAGVALLSCKNEISENYVRLYYDCKLQADTIQMEIDELQALHDSLYAIRHNDGITYVQWQGSVDRLTGALESRTRMMEMCGQCSEDARRTKKLFDRNYFKIYKKELIEQGRIKE
jgi:hypothetical protein